MTPLIRALIRARRTTNCPSYEKMMQSADTPRICQQCDVTHTMETTKNHTGIREAKDKGLIRWKVFCGWTLTPRGRQLWKQLQGDFT